MDNNQTEKDYILNSETVQTAISDALLSLNDSLSTVFETGNTATIENLTSGFLNTLNKNIQGINDWPVFTNEQQNAYITLTNGIGNVKSNISKFNTSVYDHKVKPIFLDHANDPVFQSVNDLLNTWSSDVENFNTYFDNLSSAITNIFLDGAFISQEIQDLMDLQGETIVHTIEGPAAFGIAQSILGAKTGVLPIPVNIGLNIVSASMADNPAEVANHNYTNIMNLTFAKLNDTMEKAFNNALSNIDHLKYFIGNSFGLFVAVSESTFDVGDNSEFTTTCEAALHKNIWNAVLGARFVAYSDFYNLGGGYSGPSYLYKETKGNSKEGATVALNWYNELTKPYLDKSFVPISPVFLGISWTGPDPVKKDWFVCWKWVLGFSKDGKNVEEIPDGVLPKLFKYISRDDIIAAISQGRIPLQIIHDNHLKLSGALKGWWDNQSAGWAPGQAVIKMSILQWGKK